MNLKTSVQATEITENTEMKRVSEYSCVPLMGENRKAGNLLFFSLCSLWLNAFSSVKHLFAAILLAASLHAGLSAAQEVKPFVKGSMKALLEAHQGKPLIVGFWSLSCVHCREELSVLGQLSRKFPRLAVVLVSTDTPEEGEAVEATLKRASLQRAEAWVFADAVPERLYFEVDRKWRGELPRTYLYDAAHHAAAFSGKIDPAQLEQWIRINFAAD